MKRNAMELIFSHKMGLIYWMIAPRNSISGNSFRVMWNLPTVHYQWDFISKKPDKVIIERYALGSREAELQQDDILVRDGALFEQAVSMSHHAFRVHKDRKGLQYAPLFFGAEVEQLYEGPKQNYPFDVPLSMHIDLSRFTVWRQVDEQMHKLLMQFAKGQIES